MLRLFFSYSHRDETLRDELEIHLAQLRNQGVIETWHDRRIPAGDDFDDSISQNLQNADIILLLVSPYFLASRYCYQIEMNRALERHERKEARVIPVILEPCDWKTTPFAKLQATPRDGKPVSKYPNLHDAFLEITQAIRGAAANMQDGATQVTQVPPNKTTGMNPIEDRPRSSNLRIKKEFSDQDRDLFLDSSFEYMAAFFENSLSELQSRNPEIAGRFRRVTANHFTAEIYRNGKNISGCGIRLGSLAHSREKQILYSNDPDDMHGCNEILGVADDGHTLFLRPQGFSSMVSRHGDETAMLTKEGASELYWNILIDALQR